MTNLDKLPERFRGPMLRYIEHGISGGHFLDGVMSNDLLATVGRADRYSQEHLVELVKWVYSYAPRICYGSSSVVDNWTSNGGWLGAYGGSWAELDVMGRKNAEAGDELDG